MYDNKMHSLRLTYVAQYNVGTQTKKQENNHYDQKDIGPMNKMVESLLQS